MNDTPGAATPHTTHNPQSGRAAIEQTGLSYLPQFIEQNEAQTLIEYFGGLHPLWEQRHSGTSHGRSARHGRQLTRPVYWLGAWQFASLGYYAEPEHRLHRCLRAEPFPPVMRQILERLKPVVEGSHTDEMLDSTNRSPTSVLPNTCLINYYGRKVGEGVPVDCARLRMHRDGEPGPVIMFNIGQAGLLEFLDPEISDLPELSVWTRHRSVTIISGPDFKDRLYHRVSQVRTGAEPAMHCRLKNFQLRRVSVSFRHVPGELIEDYKTLPSENRQKIQGYVEELSRHSAHFRKQWVRGG